MANPVSGQQSIPKLESPLVDKNGVLSPGTPWYQLFVYLWTLLGSGKASPTDTVNIAQNGTAQMDVFDSSGNRIGSVTLGP